MISWFVSSANKNMLISKQPKQDPSTGCLTSVVNKRMKVQDENATTETVELEKQKVMDNQINIIEETKEVQTSIKPLLPEEDEEEEANDSVIVSEAGDDKDVAADDEVHKEVSHSQQHSPVYSGMLQPYGPTHHLQQQQLQVQPGRQRSISDGSATRPNFTSDGSAYYYGAKHQHPQHQHHHPYQLQQEHLQPRRTKPAHLQYPEVGTIFIADLLKDVTELDLVNAFQRFGPVLSAKVVRDKHTGIPRGHAYVNFATEDASDAAIKDMNYNNICGGVVRVMRLDRERSRRNNKQGNLFLRNIHERTKNAEIRRLFEPFGEIASCKLEMDGTGQRCRGFGYIQYVDPAVVSDALENLQGSLVNGYPLKIEPFKSIEERDQDKKDAINKFTTIIAKNLPSTITPAQFLQLFEQFGNVRSHALRQDENTNALFGFVSFNTTEEARHCIEKLHATPATDIFSTFQEGNLVANSDKNDTDDCNVSSLEQLSLVRSAETSTLSLSNTATTKSVEVVEAPLNGAEREGDDDDDDDDINTRGDNEEEGEEEDGDDDDEFPKVIADEFGEEEGEELDASLLYVQPWMNKSDRKLVTHKETRPSDRRNNVVVKNLPHDICEDELRGFFADCGEITSLRVVRDKDSGDAKLAYISFTTPQGASEAVLSKNNTQIHDTQNAIFVTHHVPRRELKRSQWLHRQRAQFVASQTQQQHIGRFPFHQHQHQQQQQFTFPQPSPHMYQQQQHLYQQQQQQFQQYQQHPNIYYHQHPMMYQQHQMFVQAQSPPPPNVYAIPITPHSQPVDLLQQQYVYPQPQQQQQQQQTFVYPQQTYFTQQQTQPFAMYSHPQSSFYGPQDFYFSGNISDDGSQQS
eukprot:m.40574 g.40574  ORF g.40574 m.40574 type:complete len:859 (-) comp6935_c1_seq3:368-2944(-)